MAEQTEKAFLKQPKVFLCSKKSGKGKVPGKGGNRYWKSIGLGFKTPREATEGTYIDKKCPFTGDVSIRGRIIAGTCHSAKMVRTIIVRRNYLHWVKKYQRYEKRHSNIPAHISPCFRVKEGDHVTIGQCRPLSKTVRFNVLKVIPAGSSGLGKKAFTAILKTAEVQDFHWIGYNMEAIDSKMGTEVEHASASIQTTVTAPPSTASTSAPKTSMFAKRSGFVIPKNKLSGSLVPVFRGPKKGDADLINEEATKQVQRKTKWGPDLTMDNTVRKGRALAYQTRMVQISQQLTLGVLELEDNEDSFATSEYHRGKTSHHHQLSHEESEQLEIERREIIGEILKLNPAFKTPADYKPLLKEAKVPIPSIKERPGYNFIGLVFGPLSDTQKRVEKETGAKIQVYGTKADTGAQVEITADGKEVGNAYEDMYVYVSADTYEKVDAAVALIELLVTSVSVNPVSSSTTPTVASDDNVNTNRSQSTPSSIVAPPPTNQGTAQPYPPQGQFPQYHQAWFPGPTQTPMYRQSGLVNPTNTSATFLSNTLQGSSSPFNPVNMPSLFGPRPVMPATFNPVLQNPSAPPGPQPSYMQQAPPHVQTGGPQPSYMQHAPPLPGPPHNLPHTSQPPFSASESARWLPSQVSTSASQGPSHGPPMNIPSDMLSPLSSRPVANQQSRGGFSHLLQSTAPESTPPSIGPVQPGIPQMAMRPPPSNAGPGSAPMPFPMQPSASHPQPGIPNSFSGNAPNFDSLRPVPGGIPRPQQPSSGDFTFQPHRPPNAASQVWQTNQATQQNIRHPVQAGQASLSPQSPLMRPLAHNMNPSPIHGYPRPQVSHPVNQPRGQIPTNFAGSQAVPLPPRHPMMPGHNAVAVPNMQPRNFVPHPINNSLGPFPPRPGSQMHSHENHLARPPRFPTPHQHFGNHPGRPFPGPGGVQQVYDPFSPTSVAFNSQMGGNAARRPSESDPEYEDLMASVGVK
ncbi:Nucleic acid-binding [Perilla frutescens var. hirtella]|nr:Nucleic acid-binding [Perilla frutescens var. hirtella]